MADIIERDGEAWVKCQRGGCERPAEFSAGTWVFCPEHIDEVRWPDGLGQLLGEYCSGPYGTILKHGRKALLEWARRFQ